MRMPLGIEYKVPSSLLHVREKRGYNFELEMKGSAIAILLSFTVGIISFAQCGISQWIMLLIGGDFKPAISNDNDNRNGLRKEL